MQRFSRYVKNTSWILGERLIGMVIGFGVAIVVARYFGPELFGVWSYALSLMGLFAVAGHMGLSGLVVRELVKDPERVPETLGTSFVLKLAGMGTGFLLLIAYAFSFKSAGSLEFWVLLIVGTSLSLRAFTVIQFWFESQVQARYASIAQMTTLVILALYKLGLIYLDSSLVLFATATLLEAAVLAVLLVSLYWKTTGISPFRWRFSGDRARLLLKKGGLIFLGSIFAMVYLKIDQVMLRWLVGPAEVGVYAVAARLSEICYFIPTAIVASFFPRLIQLRQEDKARFEVRLQQMFDLLFWLAVVVAFAVSLVAEPLIRTLFGESYTASAAILSIHIWAALFIFMRAALSKWILIEELLLFSTITTISGAIANVILNLILIPAYGGLGAAWSTLISYAVASYFSLILYKRTWIVFCMMTKAILFPLRRVSGN